jgi:hypothetical protein
MLNTADVAPMPGASVSTTAAVKPGEWRARRSVTIKSCQMSEYMRVGVVGRLLWFATGKHTGAALIACRCLDEWSVVLDEWDFPGQKKLVYASRRRPACLVPHHGTSCLDGLEDPAPT